MNLETRKAFQYVKSLKLCPEKVDGVFRDFQTRIISIRLKLDLELPHDDHLERLIQLGYVKIDSKRGPYQMIPL